MHDNFQDHCLASGAQT